jgi:anti-sigma factor RsiW
MDYLDGTLTPEQRHEVDRHLAVCPSCVEYIRGYQESVKLGKTVLRATDDAPEGVPEDLIRAVLASRKRS